MRKRHVGLPNTIPLVRSEKSWLPTMGRRTIGSATVLKPLRKIMSLADPELSISTTSIIVMLAVLSLTMLFVTEDMTDIASRTQWEFVGLMMLAWTVVVWRVSSWNLVVGKWLIIVMLIVLVFWLRLSSTSLVGTLALFAIPTCLAAAMISLPAAIAAALGSAILLLLAPPFFGITIGNAEISLGLISIAATLYV